MHDICMSMDFGVNNRRLKTKKEAAYLTASFLVKLNRVYPIGISVGNPKFICLTLPLSEFWIVQIPSLKSV